MNFVRTTYVKFEGHGDASRTVEVKSRDASNLTLPEFAFGFRFFDILSTTCPPPWTQMA